MLKRIAFGLAIVLVGSLFLQCAHSQNALQTSGGDKIGIIDFPKPFERNDPVIGNHVVISDDYQIRRRAGSGRSELIFAMNDYGKLSDNFFGVSLDGERKVRAANTQEWNQAEPLPTTRFDPFAHETKVNGDFVEYREKRFKKSGQSFTSTAALPSPNGKWLAVFSHTSARNPRPGDAIGGGGPGRGEMFVDIYEVDSGKQILSAHAPHRGGDQPGRYFDATLWVNSDYLVVPLDVQRNVHDQNSGNRLLLETMPK